MAAAAATAAAAAASAAEVVCAGSTAAVAGAAAAAGAGSLTASFGFSLAQAAKRFTKTMLRMIFFIFDLQYLLFKERAPDRLTYIAALGNHLLLHSAITGNS